MQPFDAHTVMQVYGVAVPIAILLIENDEDREFLSQLYLDYRSLMYKVAKSFFHQNETEIDEAVGNAVERICKKCDVIKAVNCNKRPSYIVSIVKRICLTRLREINKQQSKTQYATETDPLDSVAGEENVESSALSRILAVDLLNSFKGLSNNDREIIIMRHVDKMEFEEIAAALGKKEGAVRTALTRAKDRLAKLAQSKRTDEDD